MKQIMQRNLVRRGEVYRVAHYMNYETLKIATYDR